ncbi:MAG: Protein-disulfide isomerase, partial [Parcubacteria group bacterium GW2011_GWA2_47_8b]
HYIILWGSVGVAIIVLVLGLIYFGGKSDESSNIISGEPRQVTALDWVRGDITAKVTIIEYSDFQCPACGAYYPVIKRLEEKFGSQIAVGYRHFPLTQIHQSAELAATAAEAAGRQGKFWEMHDLLFENQKTWSTNSDVKEIFIGYAKQLQLNEGQFINDLAAKDLREKISASYKEGVSLGITGTPTFFLNGRKLSAPRTYDEFEKIISEKLNQ